MTEEIERDMPECDEPLHDFPGSGLSVNGYIRTKVETLEGVNLGESFLRSIGLEPAEKGKIFVEHCPFCKGEVLKPSKDCDRQYFHQETLYAQKLKELNA